MAAPFTEIADRVWVARDEWLDLNVTLVAGSAGLVVVDTHASAAAGRRVRDEVARVSAQPLLAAVNTHEHFDHTFGNAEFADVPVHAHEIAAANTVEAGERAMTSFAADRDDPHRDEVLATTVVPATKTFSSARVLDLGDRRIELIHPGRGHTAGDVVVRVDDPGTDVLVAGDLVEESGPPAYGPDCHPMDWPLTLDLVLSLVTPGTLVVPGHGAVVDRDFVTEQRAEIGIVAETIRDLAGRGVPLEQALETGEWPFPADVLADACRRGYADLPRSARQLPLI